MIDFKRIQVMFSTAIVRSSLWLQLQNVRLILFQVSQESNQYITILDFCNVFIATNRTLGFSHFLLFYPPSFGNFPRFFDVNLELVYKGVNT